MKQVDYYAVLEVRRSDDHDTIKMSYRQLARRYHPDLNADNPAAVEQFKRVAAAWAVLGDPDRRRQYDVWGHRMPLQEGMQYTDPVEVLKRAFEQAKTAVGERLRRRRGKDLNITVRLEFREALLGATRVFEMPRLDATGMVVRRRMKVTIPRGVTPSKVLRWQGQGAPGRHGGENGDLYVRIAVVPHPVFRFSRGQLCVDVYLERAEAREGGTFDVPTPWGVRTLQIPAGTPDGERITMRALGGLNRQDRKDPLVVQVHVLPQPSDSVAIRDFRTARATFDAYVEELRAGQRR